MTIAREIPRTAGRAIGLATAALATAGALAGAGPARAGDPVPRVPEVIYARTCGYCHGHNVGPVLRGRRLPAEAVELFVRQGKGAMPAFRPTEISPAELAALARWIAASGADTKEHGQ